MKLKTKVIVGVLSLATLGTLSYFTEKQSMISAKEQVIAATQKEEVKERPKKLNYTVEKFLQQYKDKPQEEIDHDLELNSEKSTTYGELKMALQEERVKRH